MVEGVINLVEEIEEAEVINLAEDQIEMISHEKCTQLLALLVKKVAKCLFVHPGTNQSTVAIVFQRIMMQETEETREGEIETEKMQGVQNLEFHQ